MQAVILAPHALFLLIAVSLVNMAINQQKIQFSREFIKND